MLTQYLHNFINNFDQKKTMDQLQSVASTKEGVIGLATAALLMSTVAVYKSTRVKALALTKRVNTGMFL